MSFRLVPNSVTLDDLERRNSPNRRVILPNLVAFGAAYVIVDHLWRYWQGITPSKSIKVRRYDLASENLSNNQP